MVCYCTNSAVNVVKRLASFCLLTFSFFLGPEVETWVSVYVASIPCGLRTRSLNVGQRLGNSGRVSSKEKKPLTTGKKSCSNLLVASSFVMAPTRSIQHETRMAFFLPLPLTNHLRCVIGGRRREEEGQEGEDK